MSNAVKAPSNKNTLAACAPRLPFDPVIEERFGVDKTAWKSLVEAIFPNATTLNSVVLALSYCQARRLDPFKRCVHIVPIWNAQVGAMVDTIWPGIGELRTTAVRTGQYAGRSKTEFGPDITKRWEFKPDKGESIVTEVTFPEWAQVTVYRMVQGLRVEFAGPQVYWLETYAVTSRVNDAPNTMWRDRPRGQIDKCAEASALRAAFPEEIGNDITNDEVGHRGEVIEGKAATISKVDKAKRIVQQRNAVAAVDEEPVDEVETGGEPNTDADETQASGPSEE
jgi:phage recombination protein Bet